MHEMYRFISVGGARRDFMRRHSKPPEEVMNLGWAVIAGPIPGGTKILRRRPVKRSQPSVVASATRSTESIPKKLTRYRILDRDRFRCVYCGASSLTSETVILHLDHIEPRSKGGKDVAGNLATACDHCNLGKNVVLLRNENLKELKAEIARRNLEAGYDADREVACFIFHKDI